MQAGLAFFSLNIKQIEQQVKTMDAHSFGFSE
jgi:hypothetical protein